MEMPKFIESIRKKQIEMAKKFEESLKNREGEVSKLVEALKAEIDSYTDEPSHFNITGITFTIEPEQLCKDGETVCKVFPCYDHKKIIFEGKLEIIKAAYDVMTSNRESFIGSASLGLSGHMTFRW